MADSVDYGSIDEALITALQQISLLSRIRPSNAVDQQERFISGEISEPTFTYASLDYESSDIAKKLMSLSPDDSAIGLLYRQKIEEVNDENTIVTYRNTPEVIQELSIKKYGKPPSSLVDNAISILKSIESTEEKKEVPSHRLKNHLETILDSYGLTEWQVDLSEKWLTTVNPAKKQLTLSRERLFTDDDADRLSIHEIGVHVLRSVNGYAQPYKLFAFGLPGYLKTEEGLATYFEEQHGYLQANGLRNYAGRVVAVDSVCSGLSFADTFERLRSYDLNPSDSWQLALRAHRGGGYIKDHVYLQGLLEIRKYAQEHTSFEPLYLGKVGLENLPFVKQLQEEQALLPPIKQPTFLPKWGNE